MGQPRSIKNAFPAFESNAGLFLNANQTGISDGFKQKLAVYESRAFDRLRNDYRDEIFEDDCVFTGSAGIAYLYYLYSKRHPENKQAQLLEAVRYLQIKDHRRPRVTFLCGQAGPLALGAVISHFLGNGRPANLPTPQAFIERLEGLYDIAQSKNTPDEYLYGRAGYLYALLFVNRETGVNFIKEVIINNIIAKIIESGMDLANHSKVRGAKLFYQWHDSYYLGGAHGIAGILYVLLQAREYLDDRAITDLIIPTLDWLLEIRYENGNLPSSLGSKSDRLVQWCHGAPGFVQLCSKAYELFNNERYRDAALVCGEVVWERGLCAKGYSICHGVAGNAYTFLQLYQMTKDPKQLYRAYCFADWCIDERPGTENHPPDSPGSLFEGLAGRIYFLADMLNPLEAKFPGYTL